MRRLLRKIRGAEAALRGALALAAPLGLGGCEDPKLLVGEVACPLNEGGAAGRNENGTYNDGPLPAPWRTSFDDGFCGYWRDAGFCYSDDDSRFRLVTSPARTGPFAAAFEIGIDGRDVPHQARCVREGILPDAATYGAWFYIPSGSSDPDNWNLVHFQGGEPGMPGPLPGSWDVNVRQSPRGGLSLYVADLRTNTHHLPPAPVELPTDRWFHLEFYVKRAADESGEVALHQDGEELLRVPGVITDDNQFSQWYVGNYANSISPTRSILYVDDVSVRLEP